MLKENQETDFIYSLMDLDPMASGTGTDITRLNRISVTHYLGIDTIVHKDTFNTCSNGNQGLTMEQRYICGPYDECQDSGCENL